MCRCQTWEACSDQFLKILKAVESELTQPTSSIDDHSVSKNGFSPYPGVFAQTCTGEQMGKKPPLTMSPSRNDDDSLSCGELHLSGGIKRVGISVVL